MAPLDKRSDAHSPMGGANSAANSALANSDMGNGMPDSDNSYAEL